MTRWVRYLPFASNVRTVTKQGFALRTTGLHACSTGGRTSA